MDRIPPTPSPWLVPTDGSFRLDQATTRPDGPLDEDALEARLETLQEEIGELQRLLYADDRFALLLVFQAMDAAGKDGTIRRVLAGMNPSGVTVHSFKQPSSEEVAHDFLWRTTRRLPRRGTVGVFNRSHYEEVLIVRVHPKYLEAQDVPGARADDPEFWDGRMASIRDHEAHLARSGTVVRKFFLHVSKEEQRRRFLDRLDEPDKNWKFSPGDVVERGHWDDYQRAYEDALRETSRPWAPWYAIPADDKDFMRVAVAEVILSTLQGLPLRYPPVAEANRARFGEMRERLEAEAPGA
ncbi:MAG TPA: PPK2 family polyphosphate kinase [Longimicrobiales bacterium]|nr:PPK2 family polyphosphate kinase [Longimicrobiales bacterium]